MDGMRERSKWRRCWLLKLGGLHRGLLPHPRETRRDDLFDRGILPQTEFRGPRISSAKVGLEYPENSLLCRRTGMASHPRLHGHSPRRPNALVVHVPAKARNALLGRGRRTDDAIGNGRGVVARGPAELLQVVIGGPPIVPRLALADAVRKPEPIVRDLHVVAAPVTKLPKSQDFHARKLPALRRGSGPLQQSRLVGGHRANLPVGADPVFRTDPRCRDGNVSANKSEHGQSSGVSNKQNAPLQNLASGSAPQRRGDLDPCLQGTSPGRSACTPTGPALWRRGARCRQKSDEAVVVRTIRDDGQSLSFTRRFLHAPKRAPHGELTGIGRDQIQPR